MRMLILVRRLNHYASRVARDASRLAAALFQLHIEHSPQGSEHLDQLLDAILGPPADL
jgi:hypothetical protein